MGAVAADGRGPRGDGGGRRAAGLPADLAAGTIFISYRRDDTSGFAGRLHDALCVHFGGERIFRDVETVRLGADFVRAIEDFISSAGVLIAVIGRDWLRCTDPEGRRRLDDPEDFVRLEIASALERDIPVIPVLVEDAAIPAAEDLPEPIAGLARRNALVVEDLRWDDDLRRLITSLEQIVGPPVPPAKPLSRKGADVYRRIRQSRVVVAIVSITVVAATLVGLYSDVLPFFRKAPTVPRMSGLFNIAVAEFSAVDGRGRRVDSPEGVALARAVHDRLRVELQGIEQSGFDVQLRPPDQTGTLEGAAPVERADAAAAASRKIGADVVVYGTFDTKVPGQFTPEFYVSEEKLLDAEEFLGQYQLGSSVQLLDDLSRNVVAQKALRDQLLGRTGALAEFVVGLSYASLEQWRPALEHFRKAEAAVGWPDADGKEVLYLFLGNAAAKLRDYDGAAGFYDRALALNPEYARARLGIAEVLLHRARGTCEPGGLDAAGLRQSLEAFAGAQRARVQPPLADIAAKVAFGQGRVYLCLSQGLVAEHWDDAERAFREVVDEFDRGNVRLRMMAAEAHAALGFVYLPPAGSSDADARFRRAAAEYERAIELFPENRDPEHRRAQSWRMLGFIHVRLGDMVKAQEAYARAITLVGDDAALRSRYEAERQQIVS